MLLRPEATFIDQATKRAERVFPRGMEWRTFTSKLTGKEVFPNSVLDPAIGIGGKLAMQTFATADWRNWISSMQIGLFGIATRIGIPPLDNTSLNQGLSLVYLTLESTASAFEQTGDLGKVAADLAGNVGRQAQPDHDGRRARVPGGAMGRHGGRSVAADNDKNITLPPLQTEDPATDTRHVTRVCEVFRMAPCEAGREPPQETRCSTNSSWTAVMLAPSRRRHAIVTPRSAESSTLSTRNAGPRMCC